MAEVAQRIKEKSRKNINNVVDFIKEETELWDNKMVL